MSLPAKLSVGTKAVYEEVILDLQKEVAQLRKENAELAGTRERYQAILNYWFPRLGYAKANEMAYPALGDSRATPAPALEAKR